MSQTYGIEAHDPPDKAPHRKPVRYVVVIDAAGSTVAMLFLETRERVAEVDAGAEEVNAMIAGIVAAIGAQGPEWDAALSGHNASERREARVYTLSI